MTTGFLAHLRSLLEGRRNYWKPASVKYFLDKFLKPVIVKKRRKVELFTQVKRQVFIRCRIWRHGLREVISKHKHAVRHFWAILLPAAPVIEVAVAVCSKSLISPISHSFSIMLSLLDQSIPRNARKNSTNIMHPRCFRISTNGAIHF